LRKFRVGKRILKLSSDQVPSAVKAFQRSSAQGRKFAHTRPQSIRKIKAITLKQNATKYSAMLQCSETKLFIHHWNHACSGTNIAKVAVAPSIGQVARLALAG